MKKNLEKLVAFLCVFAIALLPLNISAAADEKLYEKYGYQEDYEYSDVMIGHALKSTVAKIFLNYTATVSYSPVTFDEQCLLDDYITLYNMYHNTNTEDEIVAALLEYAIENIGNYLTYFGTKVVETSGSWMGSGVVISERGHIATNAHVATVNDESRVQLYLDGLQGEVMADLEEVLGAMSEYGITMTDEEIEMLYYMILEDSATRAEVIDEEIELEVCFPTADGDTALDSANKYEAEIVGEGTQEGIEGLTQDTAILKIKENDLVALSLSTTLPETNSTIVSAGYPSASDAAFQETGSDASVLSVTVGTGQVARLISIDNSKYQAIQITTTISGGNSGGPSVDKGLNIEGLNTYVLGADMRYAYMVSAEYVSELVEDFDLEKTEVTKTFLTGLQMLQQNYGDAAEECFQRVKELREDTPYIDNLIDLAKEAPDTKPSIDGKLPWLAIVGIAVGVALVVAVVILIIVISKNKKRGKESEAVTEDINVKYVNTPPVSYSTMTPPTVNTAVYPPVNAVPPRPVPPPVGKPVNTAYNPYSQPVNPPAPESTLRSTMRKTVKAETPPPRYAPPAPQAPEATESNGSRLIKSDNLKGE